MKIKLIVLSLMFAASSHAQLQPMSFQQAQDTIKNASPEIQSVLDSRPDEYTFTNASGENTVAYSGQTLRQVLINDLKKVFGSYKYGQKDSDFTNGYTYDQAREILDAFYQYNNVLHGANFILVTANAVDGGEMAVSETSYVDISPKDTDLQAKIAGVDNGLRHGRLLGWNTPVLENVVVDQDSNGVFSPDDLMLTLTQVLANNISSSTTGFTFMNGDQAVAISQAHLTPGGLDIAQMAQKLMHSALSFSQAAGDYTSVDLGAGKGLLANNDQIKEGYTYTSLEHHWDEAFGYFGAARNYLAYSDTEIRQGASVDAYFPNEVDDGIKLPYLDYVLCAAGNEDCVDGEISLQAEKNWPFAVNAAKRDLGAKSSKINFTKNIMEHFLRGRHLLQVKPEGYLSAAQAQAVLAMDEWERLIAASVIHYINKTFTDVTSYGSASFDFAKLAKHFSEMKGFAFAFQFNPNSRMSASEFERLHQLIGDQPVPLMLDAAYEYEIKLMEARQILAVTYGFDQKTVSQW